MLMQYLNSGVVEAGCDEAGRGCLAGPVYAAAVILPPNYKNDLLNDSKQLSEHQRDALRPIIERYHPKKSTTSTFSKRRFSPCTGR